jgi:phage-related protein
VKPVRFLGDSLERLRRFPEAARQDAGFQLERVQRGEPPSDFKPVPAIGRGVEEIRVRDESGAYRVIYMARLADAVYVLHAFQKKTQATPRRDIELARKRHADLMGGCHEETSCKEIGVAQRELCKRVGRHRRLSGAGRQFKGESGDDAADRGHYPAKRMDASGSGPALRRHSTPDERPAARPHLAFLAGRPGQSCDGFRA